MKPKFIWKIVQCSGLKSLSSELIKVDELIDLSCWIFMQEILVLREFVCILVYILSISDENWQKVKFWKTTKRVTLGKKYMPAFKDLLLL